jgi:hypothetical protein
VTPQHPPRDHPPQDWDNGWYYRGW